MRIADAKKLLVCRQTVVAEAAMGRSGNGPTGGTRRQKEAVVAARLQAAGLEAGLSQRELGVQAGMDRPWPPHESISTSPIGPSKCAVCPLALYDVSASDLWGLD